MDQWGPKHVELTYVMNKTKSLKTLRSLLECIYLLQDDTWSLQYHAFIRLIFLHTIMRIRIKHVCYNTKTLPFQHILC